MPMYRYHCNTCDKDFNALELANDPPTTVCECDKNSTDIQRVLGVPSISFKGKGFYVSDKRALTSGGKSSDKSGKKTGNESASESNSKKPKTSEKVAS